MRLHPQIKIFISFKVNGDEVKNQRLEYQSFQMEQPTRCVDEYYERYAQRKTDDQC